MKLSFLGAGHEVTGSRTLLQAGGHTILVDYGMEQGVDVYENPPLPMAAGEIDCILLTHAHMDHAGMIPALVAQGFRGPIYATEATARMRVLFMVSLMGCWVLSGYLIFYVVAQALCRHVFCMQR